MKKKIINIIEIILVIILLTSLYRIYNYNKEDKNFKSATREVQEKFEREEVKTSNPGLDEKKKRDQEAIEKIEALRKDYPSVVGWIRVGGTDIDYPIVKGSDKTSLTRTQLSTVTTINVPVILRTFTSMRIKISLRKTGL